MANVQWQTTLDTLKQQLQGMDLSAGATAETIPEGARAIFRQAKAEKWDNNRKIFTYGQLDPEVAIPCCRAGLIDWWTVHTGRAYFGDADGMKKVYSACAENPGSEPVTLDLSAALTWTCFPHTVTEGVSNRIEAAVVRQLLSSGADANYKAGEYFEKALRNCGTDVIGAFLDHGGFPHTAYRLLDEMTAKNAEQAARIQEAIAGRALYAKLDDHTLSEAKYVPGPEGGGVFRTLFNFRAKRVNEIYEYGRERKAIMNSTGFDDYDPAALNFARKELEKRGGKPADEGQALDKPRPSPRGLAS